MRFPPKDAGTAYTVSTGTVLAATGEQSGQIDLIIHDRLETPELIEANAWRLVPVETVYAVISVKTTLDRPELKDAMASIASVRRLPRVAAAIQDGRHLRGIPESATLRPRGFVFAFKSSWAAPDGAEAAFKAVLEEFDDDLRPNGLCILNQCFLSRRPYTTDTRSFARYALMHFFVFLSQLIDSFPRYKLNLAGYFREDYGQA